MSNRDEYQPDARVLCDDLDGRIRWGRSGWDSGAMSWRLSVGDYVIEHRSGRLAQVVCVSGQGWVRRPYRIRYLDSGDGPGDSFPREFDSFPRELIPITLLDVLVRE